VGVIEVELTLVTKRRTVRGQGAGWLCKVGERARKPVLLPEMDGFAQFRTSDRGTTNTKAGGDTRGATALQIGVSW
jgi:hypothetical protein